MKKIFPSTAITIIYFLIGCQPTENSFDASGIFEADEIIVSAETAGKLLQFDISEGKQLKAGQIIGTVDCRGLALKKAQAQASISALSDKKAEAGPQVDILDQQLLSQQLQVATLEEQVRVLQKEQERIEKLVKAEAVPVKQLDDIEGQIDILEKQISAAKSQEGIIQQQIRSQQRAVNIQNRGILSEVGPMELQVAQLEDQLRKCTLQNPIDGTVLLKYAEANELAAPGKALYKIANLDSLTLRAYISGSQLSAIRLNQQVQVLVDDSNGSYRKLNGRISWISDKAEFTPKTIQTKEERTNLVYASKIEVKNDGYLKIGMYGEVLFQAQNSENE